MAQHARDRDHRHGSLRPLADRLRIRLLLRISRRGDLAVRATALREHDPGRAAARSQVPPDRGHGRQGPAMAAPSPGLCARQAFLDVLGPGRRARAAPRLQGLGRPVRGQVRRRMGRLPRARLPAPEAVWMDPARDEADLALRHDGVLGQHPRGRASVPAPADGGLCRVRRAHRRAGRTARRRHRSTRSA